MSYRITSSRYGRLGGLVFRAASWHQKARDDFRSRGARDVHLAKVVNNARLLILPSLTVPNLRSHILSLVRKRLPGD